MALRRSSTSWPARCATGAGGATTTRSGRSTSSPTTSGGGQPHPCRTDGRSPWPCRSTRPRIQTGTIPGRANPVHAMTMINAPFTGDPSDFCTSDDTVHMGLQCATHWDGLGHVSYDNQLYNGYPADTITESGASRCGIHHVSTLVSRGVLLDVARAKGVRRLDGGYAIGPDDLDAAAELAGVAVEPGDVVLVRTGQMEPRAGGRRGLRRRDGGARDAGGTLVPSARRGGGGHRQPGVRGVPLRAGGRPAARAPPAYRGHGHDPGQNWVLDALADDCAADGRYTFLLSASPEPFVNAVGSPVNPVAIVEARLLRRS